MKRNHRRTNRVPLKGNKQMAIEEFFHIKTSDLYYLTFFKIQNLNIRSKKEKSK